MLKPARTAFVAVLAAIAVAASGCAKQPAGTDGDLTDGWQPMTAAKWDIPAAGECLDSPTQKPYDSRYYGIKTITCDRSHAFEVAAVLEIEGEAAKAAGPPADGSAGYQAAYAACGKAVNEYVGGEWSTGQLGIQIHLPIKARWDGGLRSYLCAVYQITDGYGTMGLTSATLKGSLTGAAPKALRCLTVKGTKGADNWWSKLDNLTPSDCAQPHDAEFVGTFQAGAGAVGPMPEATVVTEWAKERCWPLADTYVGAANLRKGTRGDVGISWDRMDEAQWNAGIRFLRCFVLLYPGKTARGSIKGLGLKPLPV